jgi:hypothetical protein
MEGIYKAHFGCSKQTSENTLYVIRRQLAWPVRDN